MSLRSAESSPGQAGNEVGAGRVLSEDDGGYTCAGHKTLYVADTLCLMAWWIGRIEANEFLQQFSWVLTEGYFVSDSHSLSLLS